MPLQAAAELAQRRQLFAWEIARMGERRVQHRRGMAFGQHEPVALRVARVRRVVAHHAAEIQRAHDLGRRKRPSRMAASRLRQHLHDVDADLVRLRSKPVRVHAAPFVSKSAPLYNGWQARFSVMRRNAQFATEDGTRPSTPPSALGAPLNGEKRTCFSRNFSRTGNSIETLGAKRKTCAFFAKWVAGDRSKRPIFSESGSLGTGVNDPFFLKAGRMRQE